MNKFKISLIFILVFVVFFSIYSVYKLVFYDPLVKSTKCRVEWTCNEIDLSFFTWHHEGVLYSDDEFVSNGIEYEFNVSLSDEGQDKKLYITGTSIENFDENTSFKLVGKYRSNKLFGYGIVLYLEDNYNGYDKLTFTGKEIGF